MVGNTPQGSIPRKPDAHQSDEPAGSPTWNLVKTILRPFASLWVTVVLLAMAIFIVYAGTTAQVKMGIWQVVDTYFRIDLRQIPLSWSSLGALYSESICWIQCRMLLPAAFFPSLSETVPPQYGFYFPKGWTIGLAMFINLASAHLIRFRIQARGGRLLFGSLAFLLGCLVTSFVIVSGSYQTANRPELFVEHPSLRILWLLTQCTVASGVLAVGCWYVFGKRSGIVLLHLGIGLLMLGELLVGVTAVESQMQIIEGQTVNYVLDTRELEIALIDESNATTDDVFAIPLSLLLQKGTVDDDDLPVKIELVKHFSNCQLQDAEPGKKNLATAGRGLTQIAQPIASNSSTDKSGLSNEPAVYIHVTDSESGKELGVYLLALREWMRDRPETLKTNAGTFIAHLRYRHDYKPYSMHLINVEQQVYMGTTKAKSYASELRLVDKERQVDREVRIWMNNPLRYAGATFYQSNYGMTASGREYTGLQVVTNTGWRIPYMACMMVVVGMMIQFSVTLVRHMGRVSSGRLDWEIDAGVTNASEAMDSHVLPEQRSRMWWQWAIPAVIVLLCMGWLLWEARLPSPGPGEFNYTAFGQLPVTFEGRVKPMDTLARSSLRQISDQQEFEDEDGNDQPATRWLLDVITGADAAREHKVFRIHSLEVLDLLGLKRRKGFRYSIAEIFPKNDDGELQTEKFEAQVQRVRSMPAEKRDLFADKVLDLDRRINEFLTLREAFRVPRLQVETLRDDLQREAARRSRFSQFSLPLAVPPQEADEKWQAFTFAVFDAETQRLAAEAGIDVAAPNEAALALRDILSEYAKGSSNAASFNQQVEEYQELLTERQPEGWNQRKGKLEVQFNHAAPMFYSMILYLVAAILGCLAWLFWTDTFRRASIWLCIAVLIVHTLALVARIYISGRPPVTTLYTSTLFVGWSCVLMGLFVERFSRIGIANVVAAAAGFIALLIGYKMTTGVVSFQGDSFTVLVAVLDTNFWLATHVTCITAGYGATILAGLLGIAFIVQGVFTPALTPSVERNVGRMIYGVVCFAIFFSFFGTVLGGLWADDSWGRFWGWDPKENGAPIIVLWNAIVLHALWGRIVRERGLAVLSVFGIIVTAWSWFGVNELGVGLHSYGFTNGVRDTLEFTVKILVGMMIVGVLPRAIWVSTLVQRRTLTDSGTRLTP